MRPPMAYYGGKTSLATRISRLLPAHAHYVEPFAGSLAVLLAKPASRMETLNDLDQDLMTFWRVLRERPEDLARVCALTPHSRAEHQASYGDLSNLDDVERARRVWVRLTQGRTSTMRRTGWRHYAEGSSGFSMPRFLTGYLERMLPVAHRLASVSLEARPALDVIESYGRHRSTLLYVDPPYLAETRKSSAYQHEMPHPDQHRALAETLQACRATVVLSGYPSDLYDNDLYRSWYRYTLSAGTSQGGQWAARTEVLWSNRPLEVSTEDLSLFDSSNETSAPETEEGSGRNERRCEAGCGLLVTQPTTGRPRRYCSTACRGRAHRAAKTSTPT